MMIRNELRASLFLIPVMTLTIFGDISCGEEPEIGKPLPWPASIDGRVVSTADEPIADATVTLNLLKLDESDEDRWVDAVDSIQVQTNEQGLFRIPTADLPLLTQRPLFISIYVEVDGYADGREGVFYGPKDSLQAGIDLHVKVKLTPGRLVTGRCVDPSGTPVVGAVVHTMSGHLTSIPPVNVSWKLVTTSKSGRFHLRAPDDGKLPIISWISHPDWAPQYVEVPLDRNLFRKDIELKQGGILSGIVRTIDGKPAEGIVVAASSQLRGPIMNISFQMRVAVKTDANGKYQLPPLDGEYTVALAQKAIIHTGLEMSHLVSDQVPPLVVPQIVSLKSGDNQVLDFNEHPTMTMSGRISWPNGDPVPNHGVHPYYTSDESRTKVYFSPTQTDEDGNYVANIPENMTEFGVTVYGIPDENRIWHWAHPAKYVVALRKATENLTFGNLNKNRAGIDWVMRAKH